MDLIFEKCKKLFLEKLEDYDLSWIFLKENSIIDQIFIKIFRIKNIKIKKSQSVIEEEIIDTYIDIINYIIILLIKLYVKKKQMEKVINHNNIINLYNKKVEVIKNCMKNNLYKKKFSSIEDLFKEISYLKNHKEIFFSYEKLKKVLLIILKGTLKLLENKK
ncbi:nucleotide modification associated domain-containing protein [Blattabacterium cuenoti]|uniref:nucleotide modification associated domain-containing protein n=1 Tax=Blattabacterium cuenoti TaxID=1653831 RepID=UPI00163B734F|nr:nucleotide modification associated domain-containing protein [Blattabacterium cuenoti]